MFVVVNHVSIADASEGRYEMDIREHAEQYLVTQPGFRRLELLHPETDGDYLLVAYWDSEARIRAVDDNQRRRGGPRRVVRGDVSRPGRRRSVRVSSDD
jgi:heme-degrading monooxygenase HmoA